MTDLNEPLSETNHHSDTSKLEVFNVLSALDPDDCDNLDPFNFLGVTTEELDDWLHESLGDSNGGKNDNSKSSQMGRRLSMCLGREIQRRNSLVVTCQANDIASRRSSTFSDFSSDSHTLPKYEQDRRGSSTLFDEYLAPPYKNSQQRDDIRTSKRQRTDCSPSPEDQLFQGGLFAALAKSSQSMNAFCKNSMAPISSSSASIVSASSTSTSNSTESSSRQSSSLLKSSVPLTTAVPLTYSVSPGLASCMTLSEKSEQEIQNWDRRMGLKKSHSKTMRATGRSRKKLQELQKEMWHGEKKETRARIA